MFIASSVDEKGVEGFNLEQMTRFSYSAKKPTPFKSNIELKIWFSDGKEIVLMDKSAEQLYTFLSRNTSLNLKEDGK